MLPPKRSATKSCSARRRARGGGSTAAPEDLPFEQDARCRVPVAERAGERGDCRGVDPAVTRQVADDPGRQGDLPRLERAVERRPGGVLPVAEVRVAGPEVDADGGRLVGVGTALAERRPAPGPDRMRSELPRHLARRERLQLHDVEPLPRRLQPLAAALAECRVELQLERDAVGRDADVGELPHERAHRLPHRATCQQRATRVQAADVRAREEDLPDQDGRRGQVAPPLRCLVARVGRVGDRDERPCATLGEAAHVGEHVRAVLRGRRRPGSRRLRAEELVLGDPGRRAARDRDGVVVETVGPADDRRRVGRLGRRAHPVVEVEVEEDGRGTGGPGRGRHLRA